MSQHSYKKLFSTPRVKHHALVGLVFLIGSLAVGTVGYEFFGHGDWFDAFYNASMILTGMGPGDGMPTSAGKLFASLYAIYSGVAFLGINGFVFAPILHGLLKKFHADE